MNDLMMGYLLMLVSVVADGVYEGSLNAATEINEN